MDPETMLDAVLNVGVKDGKIAAITKNKITGIDYSMPIDAPLGFDELILNGITLGAPVLGCHDNDFGWWEVEEKLQALRNQAHNVWAEYYP